MSGTIEYKRCESCGGIDTLDEHYKCKNCGAVTSPEKAVHVKRIKNYEAPRWDLGTGFSGTYMSHRSMNWATYGVY